MKKIKQKNWLRGFWFGMASWLLMACQPQPATTVTAGKTGSSAQEATSSIMKTPDLYTGIEFSMPRVQEPQFPNYSVNIKDFGAVGDGLTENTLAIEKAIAAVAAKGGGKVIIPRGLWLTGPIVLRSNLNLHAEAGSMIIFSKNFDLYPLVQTSFEGLNTVRCQSPISGKNLENVAITGSGTFDGSGDAWRPVKKSKLTDAQWKELVKSGGVLGENKTTWYPSESSRRGDTKGNFNVPNFTRMEEFATVKDFMRPVMLSLISCKKVLLDGPTFQNSPAWNLHPLMCEDVTLRNLNVRNPWYSQNGDGLDLESCKNVIIYNNTFDVGDDAICIKSGKDKNGRDRGVPTENVIVKNNVVYHGHGGFVVGSEMSSGVKNVHVSDCTFMGTDIGLRFKSTRGRGGVVENIWISNIDMVNIPTQAISFNLFYGGNSPMLEEGQSAETEARVEKLQPVTEETPAFKNIFMKNINVAGADEALLLQGLPEMNLKNVHLENSTLKAKKGISAVDADGIVLKNVKVLAEKGPALSIYNSKNFTVAGLTFPDSKEPMVKVTGPLTKNIKLADKDFKNKAAQIAKGKDLAAAALQID